MKYLIITIALITTLNLNAQDNFTLNEGKVTWQKVYETKKSKEEIISYFKSSGLFKLFRVEDGKIIATLRPQPIDKDDKKIAGTLPPALVVKAKFAGTVVIGLKDDKYRVTYKDILIVGSGEIIKKGEKQPFEKHYVNKDGKAFRISFNKKPKTIYNLAFNQTFEIEASKKDDW
ncbi:MAG: hypothetical protein HRT73_02295 [Flavobacteriales bacterium]|nr:hypothetical protein [Flavobacteriales bacterium]NQX96695.1 hypothetical protein [Flavobacteriales bacterium]